MVCGIINYIANKITIVYIYKVTIYIYIYINYIKVILSKFKIIQKKLISKYRLKKFR